MSAIDLGDVAYIGGDIVKDTVDRNKSTYQSEKVQFHHLDLTKDALPKVDLILCRDCLTHLSMEDISKALKNIFKSGSKYLLVTSYDDRNYNYDIVTGDWRPLNLLIKAFFFKSPIFTSNEGCTEARGAHSDKSLYLYEIEKLKNSKIDLKSSKLKTILHLIFGQKI